MIKCYQTFRCLFDAVDDLLEDDPRMGDVSRPGFEMTSFWTAMRSLILFRGSLRSSFSSSAGVYWSRNSSIERNPPPTRISILSLATFRPTRFDPNW